MFWLSLHRRLVRNGPRGCHQWALFLLLVPVGWLYGLIGRLRAELYRRGHLPSFRASVPVISVGNLAAGGTGKTPVVDYVVRCLLAEGRRVAVVSRGYGGSQQGLGVVSAGTGPLLPPELCGDEPYLLARRNPAAVVLVSRRRPEGMRAAVERFGAEVIVLDDGFQHLAAARDLDIVLLDARSPLGNGRLLPAGVLRESPSALRRGGVFILTRCGKGPEKTALDLPGTVLHSRHRLADTALTLAGEECPLTALRGKRGIAFAGIADPEAFFADLTAAGLNLAGKIAFPDHAPFGAEAIAFLERETAKGDYFITTEKDAVKLEGRDFSLPCYRVPLRLEILEADIFQAILQGLLVKGGTHGNFAGPA